MSDFFSSNGKARRLIGAIAVTGVLTVAGLVSSGAIKPSTNNGADLGAADRYFANIFVSTSTISRILLGTESMVDTQQHGPLIINYTPTQLQANNNAGTVMIRTASSTYFSAIEFKNAAFDGDVGAVKAYNESHPGFDGIQLANKVSIESTSGTLFLAGEGVALMDQNGVFRPVAGLGFGGGFAGLNGNASTTISDGNMVTVSLDFPNSAAAGTQDLTASVPGAYAGAECQLAGASFASTLFSRASEAYTCVGTGANTVTVRRTCVASGGCGDPADTDVDVGFFGRQ